MLFFHKNFSIFSCFFIIFCYNFCYFQRAKMQLNEAKNSIFTPFYLFSAISVVLYEMLSTAFIYLPPLIGVFFSYLILSKSDAQRSLSGLAGYWYLAFAFLLFAEQLNGFTFLSSVVVFFVFYYIMQDWLIINVKSQFFMFVMFNFSAYFGMFSISNLFLYIVDSQLLSYSHFLLYYAVIESIFSFWFFKKVRL